MLVGNDSSLKLNDSDTVTLEMGAAHKNQEYRAALLTTSDGIVTYDADNDAPTIWTDDRGALTFSNKEIADVKIILVCKDSPIHKYQVT
ncbi:glycoside hydrolase family 70 protein [Leuconostoc mesenteroides]|uniref:glycoside hydrolase family 70 protein n=1 Tax=Leuconostoc mesenteroides TaxID=1245 RepID=UPI00235ECE21|nr:glycoside hydrolase family 70 protein [Leuconostoc mesenteroides]